MHYYRESKITGKERGKAKISDRGKHLWKMGAGTPIGAPGEWTFDLI
jgi:hypothetical protein